MSKRKHDVLPYPDICRACGQEPGDVDETGICSECYGKTLMDRTRAVIGLTDYATEEQKLNLFMGLFHPQVWGDRQQMNKIKRDMEKR